MARSTAFVALAMVLLLASGASAAPVRQLFLWRLTGGVKAATAAKATRALLYQEWNKTPANAKTQVGQYWVGQQDDALLFSTASDSTWADLGGYTDWPDADTYKVFKNWEKEQPSYKAIQVGDKLRLISFL
ncbi:hypothetical protein Rsub_05443 [Raphidocelis subcapitata]|uniref:Uncharacterized protein n=1 Tax=Raphidocelis subcapitata TaxID=307507 RepID=A0A2V0NYW2_9CHLO|nr:hypothetical protein Rsub_05443 [Raphidocelis subcapitata]|eukprot:GBF92824.1 hypothetical protein Rsub_05443 [Raphidocelis subcapitata]